MKKVTVSPVFCEINTSWNEYLEKNESIEDSSSKKVVLQIVGKIPKQVFIKKSVLNNSHSCKYEKYDYEYIGEEHDFFGDFSIEAIICHIYSRNETEKQKTVKCNVRIGISERKSGVSHKCKYASHEDLEEWIFERYVRLAVFAFSSLDKIGNNREKFSPGKLMSAFWAFTSASDDSPFSRFEPFYNNTGKASKKYSVYKEYEKYDILIFHVNRCILREIFHCIPIAFHNCLPMWDLKWL